MDAELLASAEPKTGAGLYLHIPFCSAICPYCDFAVLVGNERRLAAFGSLLEQEIGRWKATSWSFDTVYLGGGTPSILPADTLAEVFAQLADNLTLEADCRFYLEANPEDVDRPRLEAWQRLGISTLSLGVQAFDDRNLAFLGRRHDPAQARRAVRLALGSDFETVSLDLIFGLPGQDLESWRRTLQTAIDLGPQHLSCYQLEIHQRTPFGRLQRRGELREAPEPRQAELFRFTHQRLADAGWQGYEVSNFARAPKHRSHHNSKYWDHTPYLGLGPSAHSFAGRRRWWNVRHMEAWARQLRDTGDPLEGCENLRNEQLALERLMLGLRTSDGIDLRRFQRRYGIDLVRTNQRRIDTLRRDGLLAEDADFLRPTLDGLAVADGLAVNFEVRAD